jgi:hypothetical protein
MDPALAEHIQYLEVRIADCDARPALHRHQGPALRYLVAAARAAADAPAYNAATGDLYELARAEQLDRWHNAAAVQVALGEHRKAAAAMRLYDAGRAARSHADFHVRVATAHAEATALDTVADTARGTIVPIVVGLIDWQTRGVPELRAAALDQVRVFWDRLREHDAQAGWARLLQHRPYRLRLPFDAIGRELLRGWLADALGDAALAGDPAAAGDPAPPDLDAAARAYAAAVGREHQPAPLRPDQPPPPLEQVLAGYRAAADGEPTDDPGARAQVRAVYDQIFALADAAGSTPLFMLRLAESRLPARLASVRQLAETRAMLAHARPLSQPHAIFHHSTLAAALERARTATEVEHLIDWAGACFLIERDWSEIVLAAALRPLGAGADWALEPREDYREGVVAGAGAAVALLGRPAREILDSPRIADFFGRAMAPEIDGMRGARMGEAGLGAIQELRKLLVARALAWGQEVAARGDAAALAAGPPPPAEGEMRALALDVVDQALAGAQADGGGERTLHYWDRVIALDDLMAYLLAPPRPRPPL